MQNFQQMLDNIFVPLFEVTVDPKSHPALHTFLQLVVGFDMVDDESKPERRPSKHMRAPEEWDVAHNPAFRVLRVLRVRELILSEQAKRGERV
jgi:AMP deaminase